MGSKKAQAEELLISIAEFSELSGVSLHTLRQWDKKGYLKPKSIIPKYGRCYSRAQIEIASSMLSKEDKVKKKLIVAFKKTQKAAAQ